MAMYWKNKHNLKNASLQNIRHTKIILKNIPKPNSYSGLGTHLYFHILLALPLGWAVASVKILNFPEFWFSPIVLLSVREQRASSLICLLIWDTLTRAPCGKGSGFSLIQFTYIFLEFLMCLCIFKGFDSLLDQPRESFTHCTNVSVEEEYLCLYSLLNGHDFLYWLGKGNFIAGGICTYQWGRCLFSGISSITEN